MSEEKKIICNNKKAFHEYFIEDKYEAGISLVGTEVKSVKNGDCSMKDAFVVITGGQAQICGLHIKHYEMGNIFNHDPDRVRTLLLHKDEIRKLEQNAQTKGYTIIPLNIYFRNGKVKVEIALAKGKKLYDKRDTEAKKAQQRQAEKEYKVSFR